MDRVEQAVSLRVEHLDLTRGGRPVLRDVSMLAPPAAVTALLGPSGSGKSSLLRCLNRLEEPTSGRVLLGGEDTRSLDARTLRRRVGLVAQQAVMFDGDVEANLRYGTAGLDVPPAVDVLSSVGLDDGFLHRPARELSGGERARVAIARALIRRPQVLALDEPTAALDRELAARIGALLEGLAARGLTVVLATHDVGLAARIARRAVRLHGGAVAAEGDVGAVLDGVGV